MAEFGIDEELSNKLDFLTNDWLEVRKALKGASKASKYFNPFKILKSYETALHTTNEYRDYLKDITYDSKQNSVMQTAIREASLRLDESKGAVISAFIDLGHELVVGKTEDTFEKIIETAFEGKSLGSIFLYLDLAKIFYSTIVPVADGMSEMSKFIIYSNVSDYSWDKAYEYAGKELTQDNIAFMCQSYMVSLKSSKKAFEGMQTLFDSKAFGFSMFGNNDGLMDHRIEPTEEMLAQLALTSSCRENDSTENKDKKAEEIRELLSSLSSYESFESEVSNAFNIDSFMGVWFYSPYTGSGIGKIDKIKITKTGTNEAEALYKNRKIKLAFISDNIAESVYLTSDLAEKKNAGKTADFRLFWKFAKDDSGNDCIEIYPVDLQTGRVLDNSSYAYRSREYFLYKYDTVPSNVLSDYIGRTVNDVKRSFGDNFSFQGYSGTTVMFYDKGIAFCLEQFVSTPSGNERIIAVTSNDESKVFEKISGNMTYDDIVKSIGSEVALERPTHYFNQLDNRQEYVLEFNYKEYEVDYIWLDNPDNGEDAYIYVVKR